MNIFVVIPFFNKAFGESSEPTFKQAQKNFVRTMAGYSVICFILQIKDRSVVVLCST